MFVLNPSAGDVSVETDPNTDRIWMGISAEEFALIGGAIETVLRVIDVEEFRTRLGVTPDAARALLERLPETETGVRDFHPAGSPPGVDSMERRATILVVSTDELRLINNALNETLNGLGADEVPLWLQSDDAETLLDAIHTVHNETAGDAQFSDRLVPRYIDHVR